MTSPKPFAPDWVSPPGDTIADLLEERGWTSASLAERLGVTPKHVSELLHGKATISAETAGRLSLVLGSTAEFWLTREAQYRAALERRRASGVLSASAGWLDELPLAWMVKHGWVEGVKDKVGQVEACLRWFGVASVEAWRDVATEPLAAFRASEAIAMREGAVAAWFRRAEVKAADIPCRPFDRAGLKEALVSLRSLAAESDLDVIVPRIQAACAEHGVAVVLVAAPPGCPVHGATKWLTKEKALLALTLRYRSNDQLWFSFFHEAGHILLHGKKLLFVEGMEGLDAEREEEANRFARDLLIPPEYAQVLGTMDRISEVEGLAREIGIAPGILVGRMQREKWIPPTHMNKLKVFYPKGAEDGE